MHVRENACMISSRWNKVASEASHRLLSFSSFSFSSPHFLPQHLCQWLSQLWCQHPQQLLCLFFFFFFSPPSTSSTLIFLVAGFSSSSLSSMLLFLGMVTSAAVLYSTTSLLLSYLSNLA